MRLAVLLGAICFQRADRNNAVVALPAPGHDVSAVLKWEGILIDPIGALISLVVLEIILTGNTTGAAVAQTLVIL